MTRSSSRRRCRRRESIGGSTGIPLGLRLDSGWLARPSSGFHWLSLRTQKTYSQTLLQPSFEFNFERHLTSNGVTPLGEPGGCPAARRCLLNCGRPASRCCSLRSSYSQQLCSLPPAGRTSESIPSALARSGRPRSANPRAALHDLVWNCVPPWTGLTPGLERSWCSRTEPTRRTSRVSKSTRIDSSSLSPRPRVSTGCNADIGLRVVAEHYHEALDEWGGNLVEPDEPLAGLRGSWAAGEGSVRSAVRSRGCAAPAARPQASARAAGTGHPSARPARYAPSIQRVRRRAAHAGIVPRGPADGRTGGVPPAARTATGRNPP